MGSDDHTGTAPNLAAIGPVSTLIPELVMAHRGLAFSLLRRIGLSPGQERLLALLWEAEPQAQATLTRRLGVEAPTLTKMLARMEKAGIVKRHHAESDRRVRLVSLTEQGRALREPVMEIWKELERQTLGDMTEADRRAFRRLLEQALDNLHQDGPPPSFACPPGDRT